jgi:hypothetical protein
VVSTCCADRTGEPPRFPQSRFGVVLIVVIIVVIVVIVVVMTGTAANRSRVQPRE